jgi:hypothetical protein
VIPVQRVPVCAVEVVDVILMGYGLVSATVAVGVVVNLGGDVGAHRVLVVVITVPVMGMAVMEVVDVSVMFDCDVAARRSVMVVMVGVGGVSGHENFPFCPTHNHMRMCLCQIRLAARGAPPESAVHERNGAANLIDNDVQYGCCFPGPPR